MRFGDVHRKRNPRLESQRLVIDLEAEAVNAARDFDRLRERSDAQSFRVESHLQSLSGSEGFEVFQPLFRSQNRVGRESRQQDSVLGIKARHPGHIAGIHTIHPAHHH